MSGRRRRVPRTLDDGAVVLPGAVVEAGEVAAGADALGVGGEGGADVFVVVVVPLHGGGEEAQLAVEGRLTLGWRDGLEVFECCDQAARDLGRAGAGEADLVERETDVCVPGDGADHEPDPALLVAVPPGGE